MGVLNRTKWVDPLKANGWTLKNNCECGGQYLENFHHNSYPGYIVTIYPYGNAIYKPRFVLSRYDIQKVASEITNLEATLTTYAFQPEKNVAKNARTRKT